MTDIFTCLSDGTRRDLLERLRQARDAESGSGEVSVGELVAALELSQPTVSKHLKVLREAGLVEVREEGQHRYYRLETGPLEELEDWLTPFLWEQVPGSAEEASAAYAAWAGADVSGAGERIGRAAAETAHTARAVLEGAQEKVQGAQERIHDARRRVSDRLPWSRND